MTRAIAETASSFAIVINIEVSRTQASFLISKAANTWKYYVFSNHNSNKSPDLSFFYLNPRCGSHYRG